MMTAMDKRDPSRPWRGQLKVNESLAQHNTWRVGGPAARYYLPIDATDLASFIGTLDENEPLLWLGLGSNVLVRDGGFRGTVIATHPVLDRCGRVENNLLRAEAGTPCAKVARQAVRDGATGLEFFAGIPGTIGGALAMNAGAFGGETWRQVDCVETVDRQGRLHRRPASDYCVAYREVHPPTADEGFAAATFRVRPDILHEGEAKIRSLLTRRAQSQPMGEPSCGSVFRNPAGEYAGRLIEQCGLKGATRGGAQVSRKHANFIVNLGGATAADIEGLIRHIQETVRGQRGVELIPEVRIVGEEKQS
ncbi:MAG TPA: UDP-N-acetylmuramate dehydrogenase [Gammaproteobacteria bacterium]|nr:UDP-N-acetylmuramate dehydrogenase [Gammaproteobacteria bacterium]